jgi:hypothetical protein
MANNESFLGIMSRLAVDIISLPLTVTFRIVAAESRDESDDDGQPNASNIPDWDDGAEPDNNFDEDDD